MISTDKANEVMSLAYAQKLLELDLDDLVPQGERNVRPALEYLVKEITAPARS